MPQPPAERNARPQLKRSLKAGRWAAIAALLRGDAGAILEWARSSVANPRAT
jgi:hypothetical protein